MAAIGFVPLKAVGKIIEILAKLISILTGPFLVFIICCGIYCVVKANWQSLVILALVGGGCVLFHVLIGFLLGTIDIAGSKMSKFIRS